MCLSLLGPLTAAQPAVQQLDDDLFHLLGRVGLGEILLQRILVERYSVVQRLLVLGQDFQHTLFGECAVLAGLFQPLGLGQGRRLLGGLQRSLQPLLLLGRK